MIRTENVILKCAAFGFVLASFCCTTSVKGQAAAFQIHHEKGWDPWPIHLASPDSSYSNWRSGLLSSIFNSGHFGARIDSVNWDTRKIFVTKGPQQTLAGVRVHVFRSRPGSAISNVSVSEPGSLESALVLGRGLVEIEAEIATRKDTPAESAPEKGLPGHGGQPSGAVSAYNIERILGEILDVATRNGFLAAEAEVRVLGESEGGWMLFVDLFSGALFTVNGIQLEGDSKTSSDYLAGLMGIRQGRQASDVNLEDLRIFLARQGLHSLVGDPRFELTGDSTAVVVFPVLPLPSGSFDLSAGFLPGSGSTGNQLVGSGHIELLNAFGRGRMFSARVDRFPGQSSGVEVSFREPSFKNWPLSLSGGFEGYQQDSTYSTIQYSIGLGLFLESSMELGVSVRRENSNPLQAGQAIVGAEQRVSKSDGTYLGVETKYDHLDNRANPRRGFAFNGRVETGTRNRSSRQIVGGDTVHVASADQQKRFLLQARSYTTLFRDFTILFGLDGRFSISERPDESELVRLGGSRSLRGYDENQFRGRSAGRAFAELRAYADVQTYGYVFYDLGIVERENTLLSDNTTDLFPGFGIGLAFVSAAGPVSISYAMNTHDSLSDGRIHLGLSFGL